MAGGRWGRSELRWLHAAGGQAGAPGDGTMTAATAPDDTRNRRNAAGRRRPRRRGMSVPEKTSPLAPAATVLSAAQAGNLVALDSAQGVPSWGTPRA